jgi:hypothetical protein
MIGSAGPLSDVCIHVFRGLMSAKVRGDQAAIKVLPARRLHAAVERVMRICPLLQNPTAQYTPHESAAVYSADSRAARLQPLLGRTPATRALGTERQELASTGSTIPTAS